MRNGTTSDADERDHGGAIGVCRYQYTADEQPIVAAKARPNQFDGRDDR